LCLLWPVELKLINKRKLVVSVLKDVCTHFKRMYPDTGMGLSGFDNLCSRNFILGGLGGPTVCVCVCVLLPYCLLISPTVITVSNYNLHCCYL
jgi:hypothetical protein